MPASDLVLYAIWEDTTTANVDIPSALIARVYPNPTEGELSIVASKENKQTIPIEVFSLEGKLMATFLMMDKQTNINISHLPIGIYIIRIGSERIIIKKN